MTIKLTMPERIIIPYQAPSELLQLKELVKILRCGEWGLSVKLDGIFMQVHNGVIRSKSGKEVPNKFLYAYFKQIVKLSKDYPHLTLDGEFWSPKLTFQEIFSYWSTHNRSFKAISLSEYVPELGYYLHDVHDINNPVAKFRDRRDLLLSIINKRDILLSNTTLVTNIFSGNVENFIQSEYDLEQLLEFVTGTGGKDGIIAKNLDSTYKCGRATIKENTIFKIKKFDFFEGEIVDVQQATEVDPDADKTINEQGKSVTSKKKEDRILVEMAAAFIVTYKDTTVKVSLSPLDHETKKQIWANWKASNKNYLGHRIRYTGMTIGAKNVPRSPKFDSYLPDED